MRQLLLFVVVVFSVFGVVCVFVELVQLVAVIVAVVACLQAERRKRLVQAGPATVGLALKAESRRACRLVVRPLELGERMMARPGARQQREQ